MAMVIGLLAAPLAWLEVRAPLRPAVGASPRVGAPVVLQASGGGGAAAKAAEMLGKMGMAAIADAKPGEVPVTKEFISSAKIRHVRTISAVAGGTVSDYMALPVDQYAIYDSRLMRRLPVEEGGDGEVFELSLPSVRPKAGTFMPKPKLRVRVRPSNGSIALESVGASLFGDAAELPPDVTAAQLATAQEALKGVFKLDFNTTLQWAASRRRGAAWANATDLSCRTAVRLSVRLPAPFARAPRPLVQGAIGVVMRAVGNAILPRFAALLESDYQRWCNGTRSLTAGLGSLALDEDGYVLVPEPVLERMRAQGGAPAVAAGNAQQPQRGADPAEDAAGGEAGAAGGSGGAREGGGGGGGGGGASGGRGFGRPRE